MKELLEAAAKPLWKEIRDLALKKGTETFVSEAVKSVIEVARRRWIRRDEFEFAEWKKAREETSAKSGEADSKKTEEAQSNGDRSGEAPEVDSSQPPQDPPEPTPQPPEES